MATDLGEKFRPDFSGFPPHMSPEDKRIWDFWKPIALMGAKTLYFDVGLGNITDIPPETAENLRRQWIKVNQKRADVLIVFDKELWIVELRARATANAVGRMLMYRMLWQDDPAIKLPTQYLIVTDTFDKDVKRLARFMDIGYVAI